MAKHILYCKKCKEYTMQETCPKCSGLAITTKPAKYSPEDKWAKYRQKSKKDALEASTG